MRLRRIFFFFEILVKNVPLISQLYQMNERGDRVLFKNVTVVINSGRKKINNNKTTLMTEKTMQVAEEV